MSVKNLEFDTQVSYIQAAFLIVYTTTLDTLGCYSYIGILQKDNQECSQVSGEDCQQWQ